MPASGAGCVRAPRLPGAGRRGSGGEGGRPGRERAAGPGPGGLCAGGGGRGGTAGSGLAPAPLSKGRAKFTTRFAKELRAFPRRWDRAAAALTAALFLPRRSAPPRAGGRPQRSACLLRGAPRLSALALFPPLPGKQRSPLAPGPAPGRCRAGNQEAACPICQAFDS